MQVVSTGLVKLPGTLPRVSVVRFSAGIAKRPLASLSVEEVCGLLHALDLGQYEKGFRVHRVNGTVLGVAGEEGLTEVVNRFLLTAGFYIASTSTHRQI